MSRRWLALLWLGASACGGLTAPDAAGVAAVKGCLVRASGAPAVDVPVFFTVDGGVLAERRADDGGCFEFEAVPSGRAVLVANDFRGQGLVEAVRLFADQRLALSRRTLYPLELNPLLPMIRGVGVGEVFGDALTSASEAWCDPAGGRLMLRAGATLTQVDAVTGAVTSPTPVVSLTPMAVDGGPLGVVFAARWTADGGAVALPSGEQGLGGMQFNEVAFAGVTVPGGVRLYGSAAGVTEAPGCRLEPSGACVTVRRLPRLDAKRWLPTGVVQAVSFDPGPDAGVLGAWADGEKDLVRILAEGPAGASVWVGAWATGQVTLVRDYPGQHVEQTLSDAEFVVEGTPRRWVRLDAAGQPHELEQPAVEAGELELQLYAPARRAWVSRAPAGYRYRFVEHLGGELRTRLLELPARQWPNYSLVAVDPATAPVSLDLQFVPAVSLLGPTDGLEVLSVDDGEVRLLRASAPLSSAKRVADVGLGARPTCLAGRSVLAVTASAATLQRQVVRYDIRRIADELARAP